MVWSVPKIWEDGEVWILGGGPSVPSQFDVPESLIQEVMAGTKSPSAYSPFMSRIHSKHVIGINLSYLIGTWIDMIFFGDSKFYNKYKEDLAKHPGIKVSCHQIVEKVPWVKYLAKDTKKIEGISESPSKVGWNYNSGAAAISVAANAGAKRIILLGFDMTRSATGDQHWHDLYNWTDIKNPVHRRKAHLKINSMPFAKHLVGFPRIAEDAKRRGIEIINASPNSAITVFPKVHVKDLI